MRKPIRIAIAEDHELVRQGIVALLNDEPQLKVVLEVGNGADLLKGLKKKRVDVILLDLEMPVMDGLDATRIICTRPSRPKIIFLTAHALREYQDQAADAGGDGFVTKPFKLPVIKDLLITLVKNELPTLMDE